MTGTQTRKSVRATKPSTSTAGSESAATENRRLRGLVTRLHGCLGSLNTESRRLLSLRAGLGGAPQSAGAVARVLGVSPTRESLLEQLSLVELQSSAGSGCAGAAAAATPTYSQLGDQLAASVPWLPVSAADSPPAASNAAGTASHTPVRDSTRTNSAASVISVPAANRTVERSSTGSHGLPAAAIALFAVVLVALSLLVLPATRRQLLQASARGSGSAPTIGAPTADAGVLAAAAAAPAVAASWMPPSEPDSAATSEPQPKPETAEPPAQPEAEPGPISMPDPPAAYQSPAADPASGGSWAREHATQAALVMTVLAGGAVRLFTRGHGRGR